MGVRRNGAGATTAAIAFAMVAVACGPRARVVVVHPARHAHPVASSAWRISSHQPSDGITGYADHADVSPGGSVHFFVSTSAATYAVTAYRMGWYGGKGAGLVWRSRTHKGVLQQKPQASADTHTVLASWTKSFTVGTSGWPEGDYLFVLAASDGSAHYIPLVLRSHDVTGKVVLMNATATWQAYNAWGGYSLYHGPFGNARQRATVVGFDRPYDGNGATLFLSFERPVVSFAEEIGLPVAYVTSQDVATDPGLLAGAKAVVSMGHDEYWTSSMRDALMTARDAGTNVAFLGANAVFRHIRFEDGPGGPNRLEVNYRTEADPFMSTDRSEVTTDWREPPQPRPESVLTGALYECNPVDAPYVVPDDPRWPLSEGHVTGGASFTGLVGPEYDRVDPAYETPHPLAVLSHSPVRCRRHPSYADTSYYTATSGAGVFDAGTMRWVCALGGGCRNHGVTAAATTFVRRVTAALLRAFVSGPAANAHPAVDNVDAIGEFVGDATSRHIYVPQPRLHYPLHNLPQPTTLPLPLPSSSLHPSALPKPTSKPTGKPSPPATAKPGPGPSDAGSH
ncbi:MAG: N,N-dimethylformamidase beta subunit family domain-containing protein [Actinomycetes bacterium]